MCEYVNPHQQRSLYGRHLVYILAYILSIETILLGDHHYVSEPLRQQFDTCYSVTIIAVHHTNMYANTPA